MVVVSGHNHVVDDDDNDNEHNVLCYCFHASDDDEFFCNFFIYKFYNSGLNSIVGHVAV